MPEIFSAALFAKNKNSEYQQHKTSGRENLWKWCFFGNRIEQLQLVTTVKISQITFPLDRKYFKSSYTGPNS
jgi:hypothetical protein